MVRIVIPADIEHQLNPLPASVRNEYLFYIFNFDPIVCYFQENVQIAFLNFKGHFLKMTQFHTAYLCELAESYFQS